MFSRTFPAVLVLLHSYLASGQPSPSPPGVPGEKHTYGKYFKSDNDNTDNAMWIWRPAAAGNADKPAPAVVYFHPGGFSGMEPYTESNEEIDSWNKHGFTYVSVGYRLTTHKYYYNSSNGAATLEEFINVGADGALTLDKTGKTMADWKAYAGRQDVITKCMYDAVEALLYIVKNKEALGVDPQRLVFVTGSAGTGISNYLTYVFQRSNEQLFHTSALIFNSAQLNYPVEGLLQRTWNLMVDHMTLGRDSPLSNVFASSTCKQEMGNTACPNMGSHDTYEYDLCNKTWNDARLSTFCSNDAFNSMTIGQAMDNQPYESSMWPADTIDQHEHMKKLWYNEDNIRDYPRGADYVYVANDKNGTAQMDLPHLAVYAQSYATVGNKSGVKYAVYYTDYHGMKKEGQQNQVLSMTDRFGQEVETLWNHQSSFAWRQMPGVSNVSVASLQEQILFGCMAVGFKCDMSAHDSSRTSSQVTIV